MATFSVKNFEKFQHYKDRSPPWIKLYNELLDDYDFGLLPDASKWHLVAIWLLASRTGNEIPLDPVWVQKRICASEVVDLTILKNAGFIEFNQARSKTLAKRKQSACPEREEETEAEKRKDIVGNVLFETFWTACPKKTGRGAAEKAWAKAIQLASPETLTAAMRRYAQTQIGKDPAYIKTPGPWLNEKRWLDEGSPAPQLVFENTDERGWSDRVRVWRERGGWPAKWGPKPGEEGCKCPPDILGKDAA